MGKAIGVKRNRFSLLSGAVRHAKAGVGLTLAACAAAADPLCPTPAPFGTPFEDEDADMFDEELALAAAMIGDGCDQ